MNTNRNHAIVIGGSMTGMLTARVLSDYFQQVTIIERDTLPESPELRDGTPQARHLHVLLAKGLQIMEGLFPGISKELTNRGATTQHWGRETTIFLERGWMPAVESDIATHGISRMLLEWCVRERIKTNPKINILQRTVVKNLLTEANHARVIGVATQAKGSNDQTQEINADLVVDGSGRGSHTPEWLLDMGYGKVEESMVNSYLGYATRWYKRPEIFPKHLKMVTIQSLPTLPRGGVIMEMENGECAVTLVGVNKDYAPTDEAGFLEFAKSLASPAIYEIIQQAEPISKINGYQRTENRWQHYERMARWPDGLIVLGDAACAFNPVYGQGMTTGALAAEALGKLLAEYQGKPSDGMAQAYQKRLAKVIQTPWLMATGEDLRYPGTVGAKVSITERFAQKYIEQFIRAMPDYPEIADRFMHVMNLSQPPLVLFQPQVMVKVFWSWLAGNTSKQSAAKIPNSIADVPNTNPVA